MSSHDESNRLISVSDQYGLLTEYFYNGFGERIKKISYANNNQRITYYFYDGQSLSAEYSSELDRFKHYLYLNNSPKIVIDNDEAFSVHTDHRGAPLYLTDKQGIIVWSAKYSAFGEAFVSVAEIQFNLRLPGQYADAESGLYYNYYRDYDPSLGRYIQSDPIGINAGFNTYVYVNNNPLRYVDLLGLFLNEAQNPRVSVPEPNLPSPGSTTSSGSSTSRPNFSSGDTRNIRLLMQLARSGSPYALAALASTAVGYGLGYLADEFIIQPYEINSLLNTIRVYNPDYSPPPYETSWVTIHRLSGYLRDLQDDFLNYVGGLCVAEDAFRAEFDALDDYDRFRDLNIGPIIPMTVIPPNDDIWEYFRDQFETREEFNQAWTEYQEYIASGGARSFEDWLANRTEANEEDFPNTITAGPNDPVQREGILFPNEQAYLAARHNFDLSGAADEGISFADWWLNFGVSGTTINEGDTLSGSRQEALDNALEQNGIPAGTEPDEIIYPNTPEGFQNGLRPGENVVLYVYLRADGALVYVREDLPAQYPDGPIGDQTTHFNAGTEAGNLTQHHWWPGL